MPGPLPRIPPVPISAQDTLKDLYKAVAAPFHLQGIPHRVWMDTHQRESTIYPRALLIQDGAKLLEESDASIEKALIETGDTLAVEFQENGQWLIDADNLSSNSSSSTSTILGVPPPLFGPGSDFFQNLQDKTVKSTPPTSSGSNQKSTAVKTWKSSTPVTPSKRSVEPGTLGLGNM